MKALLKDSGRIGIQPFPEPGLDHPEQVLIRVVIAGLCRTDLYAARGEIAGPSRLVLGHEFSGIIEAVGADVDGLTPGQRVTVFPWQGCGYCEWCSRQLTGACPQRQMLGVHLHGGFAEKVVVHQSMVHTLPDNLSFQAGAYVEPVAASLAVLKAGLDPAQRGLIYGKNRISELTYRVMKLAGFKNLEVVEQSRDYSDNTFDFAVETRAAPEDAAEVMRLLKPGAHWVIKTRHPRPLQLDLLTLIPKELRMSAVNYGSFPESMALLQNADLDLKSLLGPVHPLEEWPLLFSEAERDESSKRFLSLVDESVWNP